MLSHLSDRFEAVIFDMDGVLVDAREWHYRALNAALRIFGEEISHEEHLKEFDGLPTREKLNMLTRQERLPRHLHAVVSDIKQERTLREAASLCYPKVEHLLLLAAIKNQGLKVAVATNSIRATATAMLTFAGLLPFLNDLHTNEDVQRAKPFPDIYLSCMTRLNVQPHSTLVVEDSSVGVAAARAAQCTVLEVTGPEEVTTARFTEFLGSL